ncbi:MAG: hypothetical protein ACR2JU_01415 [Nocardioidaceae bacterium]
MKARTFVISAAGTAAVVGLASFAYSAPSNGPHLGDHLVGRQQNGTVLTAENKFIDPIGTTIEQTGQVMDLALSPDGKTAVDLTKSGDGLITVVDLVRSKVLQQITPSVGSGAVAVGGLLYSRDGSHLWAAETDNLLRFDVAADGKLSKPARGADAGRHSRRRPDRRGRRARAAPAERSRLGSGRNHDPRHPVRLERRRRHRLRDRQDPLADPRRHRAARCRRGRAHGVREQRGGPPAEERGLRQLLL